MDQIFYYNYAQNFFIHSPDILQNMIGRVMLMLNKVSDIFFLILDYNRQQKMTPLHAQKNMPSNPPRIILKPFQQNVVQQPVAVYGRVSKLQSFTPFYNLRRFKLKVLDFQSKIFWNVVPNKMCIFQDFSNKGEVNCFKINSRISFTQRIRPNFAFALDIVSFTCKFRDEFLVIVTLRCLCDQTSLVKYR